MTAAATLAGYLALSCFPLSFFFLLLRYLQKFLKTTISSECLNPYNSVSVMHLVFSIISVCKQKQILNHQRRIKYFGLLSSLDSYK